MSRGSSADGAQLFIGRLSKQTRQRDLEDIFTYYGRLARCDIKYGRKTGSPGSGMAYAFVDYDDRRDAEDAIKYENGREVCGQSIVVEWARGPRHGFVQADDECYKCHRSGHWARNCRDPRYDQVQDLDLVVCTIKGHITEVEAGVEVVTVTMNGAENIAVTVVEATVKNEGGVIAGTDIVVTNTRIVAATTKRVAVVIRGRVEVTVKVKVEVEVEVKALIVLKVAKLVQVLITGVVVVIAALVVVAGVGSCSAWCS
ncbi:uncharacterized protein LOC144447981 isoform X5 [Glandiceps talaboti]